MTDRSVVHDTFVLERRYPVPPARVFAAFADLDQKAHWFHGPDDWPTPEWTMDFRVGGVEINRGADDTGMVHGFIAHYVDIVPESRIVYTYEMSMDDVRTSVSVTTIEILADGAGTRLIFTEQGAFLDGCDQAAGRREGTSDLLDALGAGLATGSVEG
jgi:uncharacterized protein YndB with AHSA1/START domain